MAWTVSREQVLANKRQVLIDVTTDSAEANLDTGLSVIDGFSVGIKSMAASTYTMHENVDSSGTASNGTIGASGLTSGDEFYIIAFGR